MKTPPIYDPRLHVGVVITRCIAGSGGVAVRGALGLDPELFRVTVITGEKGPLTDRAADGGIRILHIPALVAPISPIRDELALHRLGVLMRSEHFDVVHTHSSKAGALGRLAAARAGVPLVAHTFHGFPFHDFQGHLRHAAYIAIERRLAGLTHLTFAIGSGVASEAIRRGLARSDSIRTIAPAVDSVVIKCNPFTRTRARRLLGVPDDVPLVGTVGRMDFQKAPEILVQALSLLRDQRTHLAWIGSGPEMTRIRDLVAREGLGDRVHLLGERRDVADLLPGLDVFAMASRYEGLPCALVEAMRCGVPVVATAVNSVPDLVVPGETGLLARPGSAPDLAIAVDGLLANPALGQRLAVEARTRVGAGFDADALGAVLSTEYLAALGRTSGRPAA